MTDTLETELDRRYPLGETDPGDQRSAFLAGWVAGINFTRVALRSGRMGIMTRHDWPWILLLVGWIVVGVVLWIMVLMMVFL